MTGKGVESLSGKQLQCLELVGEGYTSAEIEGMLGISANTVNTHIALAVRKLGAPNRMHAGRMLREHRLARGSPTTLPENMTSQILRLSPDPYPAPDRQPQGASAAEDARPMSLSSAAPPPASPNSRSETDDLIPALKTVALIIAIAAAFVFVLANYPSIVGGAKDIYNAMPPTTITTH
jgi:DNA-binding CsgD family transcriptional regulator